jgi:7,8-dihydroneopterin aldolase/epimerase/oxygenase
VTDRIEDTVDYAEVCQLVALVAQQRSHRTLERLCSTVADRLLADYDLEGVWVKVSKPEPPIPLQVGEVSVEVWREPEP